MTDMVYGCDGCRTTLGRAGCATHRDRPATPPVPAGEPKGSPNDANVGGSVPAGDEREPEACEPQHHDWRIANVSPDDRTFDLACFRCGSEIMLAAFAPSPDALRAVMDLIDTHDRFAAYGTCLPLGGAIRAALASSPDALLMADAAALLADWTRLREAAQAYIEAFDMPLSTDPEVHYDTLTAAREALRSALASEDKR